MRYLIITIILIAGWAVPVRAQDDLCVEIIKTAGPNEARWFDLATGTLTDWEPRVSPMQLPSPDMQYSAKIFPDGTLTLENLTTAEEVELRSGIDLNTFLWTWDWAWSPDSQALIFAGSDGSDYFVLRATPSGDILVVPSPVSQPYVGGWSADGRFFSLHGDSAMLLNAVTLDPVSQPLTLYATLTERTGWSADRTRFAGLDDSERVAIYHHGTVEYTARGSGIAHPGWSNNGHRFAHWTESGDLLVINEGAIAHHYRLPENLTGREPSTWSPDDSLLMVIAARPNEALKYDALALGPENEPLQVPVWFVEEGVWAGQRWFNWQNGEDEQLDLIMFDAEHWQFETLQTGVSRDVSLQWLPSPDGNHLIVVYHDAGDTLSIDRLNLIDGSRLEVQTNVTEVQEILWQDDSAYIAADNHVLVTTPETVEVFAASTSNLESISPISSEWVTFADEVNVGVLDIANGETTILGENRTGRDRETLEVNQLPGAIHLRTGNSGDYFWTSDDVNNYLYKPRAWNLKLSPQEEYLAYFNWSGEYELSLEIIDLTTFTIVQSVVISQNSHEFYGDSIWQEECNHTTG